MGAVRTAVGLVKAIGLFSAADVLARRVFNSFTPVVVRVGGYKLLMRPAQSDPSVASQVFGWREYDIDPKRLESLHQLSDAWRAIGETPVVIDAGANVGYSSIFLSNLFPEAIILAIEPDEETFSLLKRNVAENDRVIAIHAALWSHERGIEIVTSEQKSWASRTVEGIGTASRRLDTLLADVPHSRPLLLKLDIEGAEREVCESCPDVISRMPCILIEPHDWLFPGAACLTPLFQALNGKRMDVLLRGENLMMFEADLAAI